MPDRFVWDVSLRQPRRGGALYRMGMPGFVAMEHSAFALGVGRRALDAVTEAARSKSRGYNSPSLLAGRPAFQRALSEGDLRLRAARALNVEIFEEAWQTACGGQTPEPPLQAQMRSCATFTTEVAAAVVSQAFRYGGGSERALPERHLTRPWRQLHRIGRRMRQPSIRWSVTPPTKKSIPAGLGRRRTDAIADNFQRLLLAIAAGENGLPPKKQRLQKPDDFRAWALDSSSEPHSLNDIQKTLSPAPDDWEVPEDSPL